MKKIILFLSLFFLQQTISAQAYVPTNVTDSLALVDLYNSTGGANWTNKTGWLSGKVSTWYGITRDAGGRVLSINLFKNGLIGGIPATILNLTMLTSLNLSSNQLSGTIPANIGSLSNIQDLNFRNNLLNGDIPSSIGNLTNLSTLDLGINKLTGVIPTSIGNLSNLKNINLDANQINGDIPTNIGNLVNLIGISFSSNKLTGSIPASIGNLTNLKQIQLNVNQLTGSIPSSIGNLINLTYFSIEGNQISGDIPSSIGNLVNLSYLLLDYNQLTGTIPSSFINLNKISYLYFNYNKLVSPIPLNIGSISSLKYIGLNNNSFVFDGGLINSTQNNSLVTQAYGSQNSLYDSLEISNVNGTIYFKLPITYSGYGDTAMNGLKMEWYKNDVLLVTYDRFLIPNAEVKEMFFTPGPNTLSTDRFYAKITHPSAPQLTLVTKKTIASDPACVAPVITVAGPTNSCLASSILLTSNQSTNIEWLFNGVIITGANSQTYSALADGQYAVRINSGTCKGVGSTPVSINVTPVATPVITSSNNNNTICTGGSITLASSSSTGNQWLLNGSVINGATQQTLSASTAGTYSVKVSNSNGCNATSVSTVITLTSTTAPVISSSGSTSICLGSSVTLTSSSSGGNQWYLNGVVLSGATANNFIANGSGSYSVRTTNGCFSSGISVTVSSCLVAPTITSFTPKSGAPGTLVTITGNGLNNLYGVAFGGVAAIPVSNTGNQLVAMVMPGAATGIINITAPGGSVSSSTNFTVTPTPYPSVQQGNKLVGTGYANTIIQQGFSVAVSADGNTAVVGANFDNGGQGAAWVYTRNNGVWTQQGNKLVATDNVGAARLGQSIAISADGNTIIAGGFRDNSSQGAAWIFTRSNGTWLQQGSKLVGSGSSGTLISQGQSVSISADGNTAVIGGPGDNGSIGATWVFTRTGNNWIQQGSKLIGTGNIGSSLQGGSVSGGVSISADGNTVVIGGAGDNNSLGAVWVFTRSGNTWSQQGSKLVGTGNTGASAQGKSVAINADGNTIAIGGNTDNSNQGAVWIFTRSNNAWNQQGSKLVSNGNIGNVGLGQSVSVSADGNTLISGGSGDNNGLGASWIFTRSNNTWIQRGNKLVGTGYVGSPSEGFSVAMSNDGTSAIIGGVGDQDNTNTISLGAAWIFIAAPLSANADLSSLTTTAGAISPAFTSTTTAYAVAVSNNTTSITVTPTASDVTATITVNGITVTSGVSSAAISLTVGLNTIPIVVTAQDGVTSKTYNITVTRAASATPTVSSFSPLNGPVGTLVTITGTNLTNLTNFTIGGVAAIAISNTGTSLVGMVMPGAATGSVSLATGIGAITATGSFTVTAPAIPNTQQGNKLVATGAIDAARQGASVAVSADGNTAIIGGYADNSFVGAVWIYTRNGGTWTQQGTKLIGTGATGASKQGYAVSISADGNTAIVGGYGDNNNAGAAWVFARSGNTWSQQGTKLVGTGAAGPLAAQQGWSVSISADGNTAIVGGYGDNNGAGAAWLYTRSGSIWTQQGNKLIGTGAQDAAAQGQSVSISADGNTAIVGGNGDNNFAGAAWVYTRSGNTWTQQGSKLVGTGATPGRGAYQGISVSLSADGNTAIIGGYADNFDGGAVWMYTRNGGIWSQQGSKLVGTGASAAAYQGWSVSISADGNTAIVGGYGDNLRVGAAWVYTRSGSTWTQQGTKLVGTGATGQAYQGYAVSISADGNTALVGGFADNSNAGATWVFVAAPLSNNANLSSLATTAGSISPTFTPTTTVYSVAVSNTTTSITITPTASDVTATITVNGISVTSGVSSGAISLTVGINTIPIIVTAQDGVSSKTYVITITRAAAQPVITMSAVTGVITTCSGIASSSIQQLTISGSALTGVVTLTASNGFEISTNINNGFTNSVTLNALAGTLSTTILFVRASSSAIAGNISGTITASSEGAFVQNSLVTATVNPIPVTPSISANTSTNICSGNNVILNANSTSGNQWLLNGSPIASATAGNYIASGSGSYAVITTVNGCTSAASASITVTVNALPSAPIITASGLTTVCSGTSVTLSSSSVTGNQWYKDGIIIPGAVNTTYATFLAGSYTDTITNISGCKAGSISTTVTLNPIPPTPTIAVGGPTSFCFGGSVTLTSNAAAGNQWLFNGVPVTNATSNTLTVTTPGNYSVINTVNSCTSAASASITVTVNALPSIPIITASGSTTVCSGTSVTLSSSAATGNQWYKDGVIIPGAINTTYAAFAAGSYTDTVTNTSGCKTGSAATVVTVSAYPAVATITAGGPTTFCVGANVLFSSSATSGNQWYKDGVAITGATNPTYTATTSGRYTDTVSNTAGCKTGTVSTTVTVNALPNIPVISASGPLTFCTGGSVTLTITATGSNQWYKDLSAISGATATTYSTTVSGSYSVITTNAAGCTASSTATVVTVNLIPVKPVITRSASDLISSSNVGNQWYNDVTSIAGATAATYRPTLSGYYKTQVTVNGCSSPMSDAYYYLITAIANINSVNLGSYQLLPNPVTDRLYIEAKNAVNKINVQVLDINGRVMINTDFTKNTILSLRTLVSGMYTVLLTDSKTRAQESKQIIKQ